MNKVIISGRLTRDAESRYTQSGKNNTSFVVAVDRFGTATDGRKEADFIPVITWGKLADACGNNLVKGQFVEVDGRLQIRSYEAKDGSGKRWVTEVIANAVEFGAKPKQASVAQYDARASQEVQERGAMESFGAPVPFDEEIPF